MIPLPKVAPRSKANDPAKAGKRASRAILFGPFSRFAVFAVHTRFAALEWLATDAMQADPVTGGPAVIAQAPSFQQAMDQFPRGLLS